MWWADVTTISLHPRRAARECILKAVFAYYYSNNDGSIINIIDIHSDKPLKNHAIYNISKAGLKMLTQTLAQELAPRVRVNGISPGLILWSETSAEISDIEKKLMLEKIALKRQGSPQDIADTVLFLANSNYITGQIINIDGGRSLNQ